MGALEIVVIIFTYSFATWVRAGAISSEQWNKRNVGTGSRSQDLVAIFFKRAKTAVSLRSNWVSGSPENKLINDVFRSQTELKFFKSVRLQFLCLTVVFGRSVITRSTRFGEKDPDFSDAWGSECFWVQCEVFS